MPARKNTSSRTVTKRKRVRKVPVKKQVITTPIEKIILDDNFLVGVYSKLLLTSDPSLELVGVLSQLANKIKATRARLYLLSPDKRRLDLVHEWCGSECEHVGENWLTINVSDLSWLMLQLWGSQEIYIKDVKAIPPTGIKDQQILVEQGITSALIFPLPIHRVMGGFIQFDDVAELDRETINILFSVVRAIGNALSRTDVHRRSSNSIVYQAIFDSIQSGILVLSINGTVTDVNEMVTQLFGHDAGFFRGKQFRDLSELFPEGSMSLMFKNIELAKIDMNAAPQDLLLRSASGDWLDIEVKVMALKQDRKVSGILIILRDITLRKRMEGEVYASESRLRRVLESVKEGITLSDERGQFTIFNQEMELLTGYTRDEANAAHQFAALIHPDDQGNQALSILGSLTEGQKAMGETIIVAKDGNRKSVIVSTTVLQQANGRMFLSAYHDITQIHQTQQELEQRNKELEQATQVLNNTALELKQARDHLEDMVIEKTRELQSKVIEVENLAKFPSEDPFPVLRVSCEGVIFYRNAASQVILDKWQVFEQQLLPESWRNLVREVYNSNTRKIVEEEVSGQVVSFVLVPVKTGGYVNLYGRDVTREKEIEQMKNEFISMVSHQIRTPLTSMRWYSEMLLGDKTQLSQQQIENAATIHSTAVKLAELVNDLLNISRMESGKLAYNPQRGDLKEVLNLAIRELTPQADKKNITLKTHLGNFDKFVFDPQLVAEIYANLISNAIKYTQFGGSIEIIAELSEDQVVSSITDDGIGIPKEAQGEIFSRFYRAQNAVDSENEGTGLGLSVAKMMVEKCGGKIWFVSPAFEEKVSSGHGGTRFSFSLPYALT